MLSDDVLTPSVSPLAVAFACSIVRFSSVRFVPESLISKNECKSPPEITLLAAVVSLPDTVKLPARVFCKSSAIVYGLSPTNLNSLSPDTTWF